MLATLVVAMPFYPEEVGSIVVSPEVVDVVSPAEASASELAEGEDKVNERYGPNYGHQAAGKLNETTLIGILEIKYSNNIITLIIWLIGHQQSSTNYQQQSSSQQQQSSSYTTSNQQQLGHQNSNGYGINNGYGTNNGYGVNNGGININCCTFK